MTGTNNNKLAQGSKQTIIAVFGLGLIGGSIAARLKQSGYRVYGFDVEAKTIQEALAEGTIVQGALCPVMETDQSDERIDLYYKQIMASEQAENWESLEACQYIFVCTPPSTVPAAVKLLRLFSQAIITDVASVKTPIMQQVQDKRFIGGHPMAGSEKTGFAHATATLLENAVYVLCLPEESDIRIGEFAKFKKMIELTGATILELDFAMHDNAVATISHLPHVVAAGLCLQAAQHEDDLPARLAAGGFRDITRIASSDAKLWSAITQQADSYLLRQIDDFVQVLKDFRQKLAVKNSIELESFFYRAARYRAGLPLDSRGALYTHSSLTVYVTDRPGELARITTILGDNEINIVNIRIREYRAYEGGCLHLLLPDSNQAGKAAWLLKQEGYECDY